MNPQHLTGFPRFFNEEFVLGAIEIKEGEYRPLIIKDNKLYMRRRFTRELIEITKDNIDELAHCKVLAFKEGMDRIRPRPLPDMDKLLKRVGEVYGKDPKDCFGGIFKNIGEVV